MPNDPLTALIDAAIQQRANDSTLPRMPRSTANSNNPLKPVATRRERRTTRPYRDPTGEQAIGNLKRESRKP